MDDLHRTEAEQTEGRIPAGLAAVCGNPLTGLAGAPHLEAAFAGEIDVVIDEMLRQSRNNYMQIEELALECSSALTSADAKSAGLSEQSLFKRLWNSITGKNEQLRTAIERDRASAQYAMQQAIASVLRECTQNRILALAVKSKLENDLVGKDAEPEGPDNSDLYQEDTERYTAHYQSAAALFLKTMDQYMESAEQLRDNLSPLPAPAPAE